MIGGRNIAVWIGVIVSLVLAVVTNLQGDGIISDALAGQITDATKALEQILVIVAPLITGILIHPRVTPLSDPALPVGTTVTAITPAGQPNHSTVIA